MLFRSHIHVKTPRGTVATEQLQRRNNSLRGLGQYGKITMKCTDIADAIRKILKSIMQRGI